jgi:hypothetical protein
VARADRDPRRPRIFGIGLNKTGTTSLHRAFGVLGYRSLHWGGPRVAQRVEAARARGEPLLSRLSPKFDAFSDVGPLIGAFQLLDEQYPGSRFILTVRPVDAWIESRRHHVAVNVAAKEQGKYDGTFLVVDEEGWRATWEGHTTRVRRYFETRSNLLELDLTAAPRWTELCAFLGCAEPSTPFPWANPGASAE